MAKDSTVNNAANKVGQSINTASSSINAEMQGLGNEITGAINDLGEGLKLTVKEAADNEKKENNEPDYAKLKSELEGLRVFVPEMADVVDFLIAINTKFETFTAKQEEASGDKSEENTEEEKEVSFDTSAKEVSALNGLTSIADIAGTGFSIVGNLLHDLTELFANVLTGITSNDLKGVLVANNLPATAEEKSKDSQKGEASESSKGVLAGFFANLTGPLESIAGGMMLLAVAMTILNAIQIDSQLLSTVIILQAFMLTTFGMVALISVAYQAVAQYFDPEGNQKGSITGIVKEFAQMVALTAATFALCAIMTTVLKTNWETTLTGLVLIFGTAMVTMVALSVVASIISGLVGEESQISKTIRAFSTLVFMIAGLAIFCYFLYPIILEGLQYAVLILGTAMITMLALTAIIGSLQITAEQINALTNLMKTVTILIGIMALFVVVLGIIPLSIITQGLVTVTLITLLVDSLMIMLTQAIKKTEQVSTENLNALMGILITTTVLIGILGVLVIVLGSMDTAALIQGLLAVTLIAAIPIVLLKVMSKIGQNASQLPNALIGVAIAGLLTVAVAAIAWLIIAMLGGFTPIQVLTTVLAVTAVSVLMVAMGAFTILMGAIWGAILNGPQAALIPLAFAGIAIAGLLAVAVAGIAALLATILTPEIATAAIIAASAIILTSTALVAVAGATIALAALAVPLLLASALALVAVTVLSKFLIGFTEVMTLTISIIVEKFGSLNLEALKNAAGAILATIAMFVALSTALLAFNIISWTLIAQVTLASFALLSLSVGMVQFAASYRVLSFVMSNLPTENLQMEALTTAIEGLNNVSQSINAFALPNPAKMLGLAFTLNFVLGFAARLGLVASDKNIGRVAALSNSLSELAQNANGLRELAGALQAVSDATKDLNDLSIKSNVSIEAISGQLNSNATEIQKLQKPVESKENPKLDQMLELIVEAVDILRNVSENLQNVTASTKQMATVQEMNARAPESVFLNK